MRSGYSIDLFIYFSFFFQNVYQFEMWIAKITWFIFYDLILSRENRFCCSQTMCLVYFSSSRRFYPFIYVQIMPWVLRNWLRLIDYNIFFFFISSFYGLFVVCFFFLSFVRLYYSLYRFNWRVRLSSVCLFFCLPSFWMEFLQRTFIVMGSKLCVQISSIISIFRLKINFLF